MITSGSDQEDIGAFERGARTIRSFPCEWLAIVLIATIEPVNEGDEGVPDIGATARMMFDGQGRQAYQESVSCDRTPTEGQRARTSGIKILRTTRKGYHWIPEVLSGFGALLGMILSKLRGPERLHEREPGSSRRVMLRNVRPPSMSEELTGGQNTPPLPLRTWKMLKMRQVLYNSKASDSRKPTSCRPSCSIRN